ncbi:TPA: cytoplasmic protein, partial [Candidatus Bathyarchaeota archaeon]|nr:cytoplasmic protein [Candidatus Bathyarchaeota archaeon]
SYQGINGVARYHGSSVEEALPVEMLPYDDRVECPEGVEPKKTRKAHPITRGLPGTWPHLLGYNRVIAKSEADVLATVGNDPLLVVGEHSEGRVVSWTSDIGPHWCPRGFAEWEGYTTLWRRMVSWASGE